jgi:hypothetical protein
MDVGGEVESSIDNCEAPSEEASIGTKLPLQIEEEAGKQIALRVHSVQTHTGSSLNLPSRTFSLINATAIFVVGMSIGLVLATYVSLKNHGATLRQEQHSWRTWTSTSGKFAIEAKLVELDDRTVVLRRRDETVTRISLDKLSTRDLRYIFSQTAEID